jgi:hypothetical protein
VLAIALVAVLVRLRFLDVPLSVDEGGYAAVAHFWASGSQLYRDVWVDRPQGLLLLYRGAFDLFGPHAWAVRALATAWGAGLASVVALLVGGYAVGLGGMIATRGLYLTPDRYFLILLVPALALRLARRYVIDFLPFIALIILYEVTRGVAHILRPHPYFAPQLDIDRWLTGTVPTIWLQNQLWDGHLSWWEAALSVLTKLHFIVPPTLLFLIWLRRRELYYRFAVTMVAVSFAGAVTFALWPAAPPWMAGRDGWIPKVHRIGYSQVAGVPESTSSWIHRLYDIRNESAAVPSLHAAYALLVVLFCFALGRRVGLCAIPYAIGMWFAIVYFGEHYVSDALIGCAYAAVGYVVVGRLWPRSPLAGPFTPPLSRARGAPNS